MAQATMYPANPGSPDTTLSDTISDSETTIPITELGNLLAAPNQVVFTDGSVFEVCVYTAKSAASGSGTITVTRSGTGHEGNAISWPNGTIVYNSPTAYTFDTIKANIEDLDSVKIEAADVTYDNLNTNGDVGTGADQVAVGNHTHSYQTADATLTALAGLATTADKLPYFTAEDTAAVADLTAAARALLDDANAAAMRATLGAASSTTAAMSVYVDSAATGDADGTSWTDAFVTVQAAVDSLPAIINHAVTIYVRKGATPYRETVTVQRIVSAGSLTIQGEYYHQYQAASNATANRLVKNASDDFSDVEVGDHVYLLQFSGTYDNSKPTNGYFGTVTDVSNKASGYVTISMDASVTPTTGWMYVICKTEISGSDNGTNPTRDYCFDIKSSVSLFGLYLSLPNSYGIYASNSSTVASIVSCIINAGATRGIRGISSAKTNITRCCIYGTTSGLGVLLHIFDLDSIINTTIIGKTTAWYSALLYFVGCLNSNIQKSVIRSLSGSTSGSGISGSGPMYIYILNCTVLGVSSEDKLGYGIYANGGAIFTNTTSCVDATTVTTAKTPANWAATTDGSYVG
jgi:hypothetical protein